MPYKWGKFQGWLQVVCGPLILVLGAFLVLDGGTDAGQGLWLFFAGALEFPTGLGILKRKRFGLILVYVGLGLAVLMTGLSFVVGTAAVGQAAGNLLVSALTSYYFYKRRHEFS